MIEVIRATEFPLSLMGEAAAICTDKEPSAKIGIECINSNHGRVLEYPDVILKISEYSARVIRELYTHIIGTTRLQESTRFVDGSDFQFYVPETVMKSEEATRRYMGNMKLLSKSYQELIDLGVSKQDAANLLPLGMFTKIMLKINLRALLYMYNTRACERAYKEYRDLMEDIREAVSVIDAEWDFIANAYFLTKCEKMGYCEESRTCGRMPSKEEALNNS